MYLGKTMNKLDSGLCKMLSGAMYLWLIVDYGRCIQVDFAGRIL